MLTAAEKLEALTGLGVQLNQISDIDILLERVLSEARRFTNADAGSIYIRQGDRLLFSYTQNETLAQRLPAGGKLIYSTFSIPIDENTIAGFAAYTGQIINIDDVYGMDPALPYNFNPSFDQQAGYKTGSMLTLPLTTHRGEIVGALQIINAQNEHGEIVPFADEDERIMSHFASIATMAIERAKLTRTIILRMIGMAEMRDPKETGAHVNRVGAYAVELYERWAQKNNVSEHDIESQRDVFRMAAMMHDVGKVAVSDTILKKPGRFTEEEFQIMKGHTWLGARLFRERQSEFDDAAALVALNHHERWDGHGYPGHIDPLTNTPLAGYVDQNGRPRGKRGEEIPIFGRIVSVCDVYDALCSKRVYKPAWDENESLKLLEQGAGSQFDPELVEIFLDHIDVIRSLRDRYPDQPEAQPTETTD
jgi:HD-GYP domain-containing protein (c-di-GMP phosphodiesterase class II)